ncbi:MAG: polysaccharide biosynthesis protein [Bacteroidota bacterium]|nr:polysaccharide biosynthesis protein [Bacteroidota bacterium]
MKVFSKQIKHANYSRIIEWGKLVSITGGAQLIVQTTALLSGLLVIRLLPTKEYAWYTLANAMLSTLTVVADGGISAGVMTIGGKIWQDKQKLGTVLSTGIALRKKFAITSLLASTPILIYLLIHHGAGIANVLLIVAALIPAFFAALSDSLLEVVPKLHQQINLLQKNQLTVNICRLLLTLVTVLIFPFAYIAVLAGGIPRIYGNFRLRKIAAAFAEKHQAPNQRIRKKILNIVKGILPGSIYYCLSGQITIWLISIFGTSLSIAEVGALGRLSMILSLFSVVFGILIIPRFARLPNDKHLVLKRFLQLQAGLLISGFLIVGILYTFSTQALSILGPAYKNLKIELILSIIGSYIGVIAGLLYGLSISRGWIINPLINIPLNLIVTAAAISLLNVSTVRGIFIFNICVASVQVLIYLFYVLRKITKLNYALSFNTY